MSTLEGLESACLLFLRAVRAFGKFLDCACFMKTNGGGRGGVESFSLQLAVDYCRTRDGPFI